MKNYLFFQIIIVFFIFTEQTCGQSITQSSEPLSYTSPESVAFSPGQLKKIDEMLKNAVKDNQIPGVVALIARKGKIIYYKAHGSANAKGRKLEKDDIFRIASQTKAITATAIMLLWEEGMFKLDDSISKYIPEFSDPNILTGFNEEDSSFTTISSNNDITIRQLMTHTSGIGYGLIDNDPRMQKIFQKAGVIDAFTTKNINIAENTKVLAQLPLHHPPGFKYTYSEGLDVLGYLVEIVSGKTLDKFLEERIFEPLGMEDTYFYLPEEKAHRLVAVLQEKNQQFQALPTTFYDPDFPIQGAKTFFSGGGGLSSTALDYAAFLQMYLNKGKFNGKRILSRTTVQTIMENQTGDFYGGENEYYGLAFGVLNFKSQASGGEGCTGTFYGSGYFNTQYFADPKEQIIGILLKQTRDQTSDETSWKFRQMVMAGVND